MDHVDRLPDNHREPDPRYLSDIAEGETDYVLFAHMFVDKEGRCFLWQRATLERPGLGTIRVERRANAYHVTVLPSHKWQLGGYEPFHRAERWLPVATISEADDWSPSVVDGAE